MLLAHQKKPNRDDGVIYVHSEDDSADLLFAALVVNSTARAVIKGQGPGIFPSYFEVYPRLLWYKTSMLTSLQQLESPAIFLYIPIYFKN